MAAPASARAALLAILLAGALAAQAAPAAAVTAVPSEGAVILPQARTVGALVGDVNGDGQRELVRLLPWDANPSQLAVEVVSIADGRPGSHGQARVQRATATDDHSAGNNPDEDPFLPLSVDEPARLIAWRQGGQERIVAASMQGVSNDPGIERPCCLTLSWVTLDGEGATQLELIQNADVSAAWIVAADMDADGTDELAVVELPDTTLPAASRVMVLRWNGVDFDRLRGEARAGLITGPLTSLGDSDGRAGEEVGYVALPGTFDQVAPTLHRISLRGGALLTERAEIPFVGDLAPMPGIEGGRLALAGRGEVQLLDWPAGADEVATVSTSGRGGQALGVLGSGADARLFLRRGGAVDVLDATLRSRQGITSGAAAAWFAASSWPPYFGELPGGDADGSPALVFAGLLIGAPGASTQAEVREMAALPGKTPVGFLGPDRAWAAVADSPAFSASRRGGSLGVAADARAGSVAIVPATVLLRPAEDDGLLQPPVDGAVLDDGQPARPILLTSSSVLASVSAPAGSAARVSGQGDGLGDYVAGADGRMEVALVEDDPGATDDDFFTVRLLVTTPAGHGYGAIWEVRVLRRPPTLTASAPMAPLSFSVPLTGRSEPGALLELDGQPVELAPDGGFTAEVSAGPLPRSVRLRATDRVGNTTELTLSVVGLVDYRRLPWIPIVAGLTLVAGVLLYLRTPKPAAIGAGDPDEGVLEEIQ